MRYGIIALLVGCVGPSAPPRVVVAPPPLEEAPEEGVVPNVVCDVEGYIFGAERAGEDLQALWGDPAEEHEDGFYVHSASDLARYDIQLGSLDGMLAELVRIRHACGIATREDMERADAVVAALINLIELDEPPGPSREDHYQREFNRILEETRTLVAEALAARDDMARLATTDRCSALAEVRRHEWQARADEAQAEYDLEVRVMLDENRFDEARAEELQAWQSALAELASMISVEPREAIDFLRNSPLLRNSGRHAADLEALEELGRVCAESSAD